MSDPAIPMPTLVLIDNFVQSKCSTDKNIPTNIDNPLSRKRDALVLPFSNIILYHSFFAHIS